MKDGLDTLGINSEITGALIVKHKIMEGGVELVFTKESLGKVVIKREIFQVNYPATLNYCLRFV